MLYSYGTIVRQELLYPRVGLFLASICTVGCSVRAMAIFEHMLWQRVLSVASLMQIWFWGAHACPFTLVLKDAVMDPDSTHVPLNVKRGAGGIRMSWTGLMVCDRNLGPCLFWPALSAASWRWLDSWLQPRLLNCGLQRLRDGYFEHMVCRRAVSVASRAGWTFIWW